MFDIVSAYATYLFIPVFLIWIWSYWIVVIRADAVPQSELFQHLETYRNQLNPYLKIASLVLMTAHVGYSKIDNKPLKTICTFNLTLHAAMMISIFYNII